MSYKRDEKNPPVLGVMSLLFPGSGHYLMQDVKLSGILIGAALVGWVLTVLFVYAIVIPLGVGVYAAYDVFTKAEKHNEEDFAKWLAAQDSTIKPGSEAPPEVAIDVPPQAGGISFDSGAHKTARADAVQTVPLDDGAAEEADVVPAALTAPAVDPTAGKPIEKAGGMTIVQSGNDTVRITGTAKFKRSHLEESDEDAKPKGVEWVSFGKK